MLNDSFKVFPVIDACGAWNQMEYDAANLRMANAGAQLETTFALACELQADWKTSTGNAMLKPFEDYLPSYGAVIENYWNNANQHTVKDPFGEVK